MKYTHRYLARIILEAETPLLVGSGETSLLKDTMVQKDHFGLPMMQGTSLTGVLRHALEVDGSNWDSFFGYQKGTDGLGSKVKISSASILLHDKKVAVGLDLENPVFDLLNEFDELPVRQHVRISDKGTQENQQLFNNEVVYRGCRFIFEIELKGDEQDEKQWNDLLDQLKSPFFRLGQGTRKGYGRLAVISCKVRKYNLEVSSDFEDYLSYDPCFNVDNRGMEDIKDKLSFTKEDMLHFCLDLKPDSFFIFGAGYGDEEVNSIPLKERIVIYNDQGEMTFDERSAVPGSSIKGAISHRTCFHYNKLNEKYADNNEGTWGTDNEAVYTLFGKEAGEKDGNISGRVGRVIIDDGHYKDVDNEKIFNHVAIDRFTGGAMAGALFSEKVSRKDALELNIWVDISDIQDDKVIKAFQNAMFDIRNGLLPLGGMTTKGHGIFTGTLHKDGNEITEYEEA